MTVDTRDEYRAEISREHLFASSLLRDIFTDMGKPLRCEYLIKERIQIFGTDGIGKLLPREICFKAAIHRRKSGHQCRTYRSFFAKIRQASRFTLESVTTKYAPFAGPRNHISLLQNRLSPLLLSLGLEIRDNNRSLAEM